MEKKENSPKRAERNFTANVTFTTNKDVELLTPFMVIGGVLHFNANSAFGDDKRENIYISKLFGNIKYDVLLSEEGEVSVKQLLRTGNGIKFEPECKTIAQRAQEIAHRVMREKGLTLKCVSCTQRRFGDNFQNIWKFEELA